MLNTIQGKRQAYNLQVSDVARLLNVSTVTVWRWERGISLPRWQHMQALGRLFACPLVDLFPALRD